MSTCQRSHKIPGVQRVPPTGWASPTMEKLLKDWRQDAMNKHQYESAIYIADKLLALTSMYDGSLHFSVPADAHR